MNGTDSSPVAFLEGLYVAPAGRRQGIAALLVDTASHAMHLALGFEETERGVYFRKPL